MSEAFSGLSKNRLDRSIDRGLSKPVNMPPSETPELPPSPLHTQLKGDGLQPLWSTGYTFFQLFTELHRAYVCICWMFVQMGLKPRGVLIFHKEKLLEWTSELLGLSNTIHLHGKPWH